jgi:ACS family tartrate transporter-like MFS transporter
LYAARFLLGITEAGFFPGILLYLTYWFRQREQALMIALIMAAIPISCIIGAPVSGFILDHVPWFTVASWRWLLILEGLPAIAYGMVTYGVPPNRKTDASFPTVQEKDRITAALAREKYQNLEEAQPPRGAHWRIAACGTWHLSLLRSRSGRTLSISGCRKQPNRYRTFTRIPWLASW